MCSKQHSIALLVPYFGSLPNYFPLWLKSCEYNQSIDWYIIIDDHNEYMYPSNVHVIYSSLQEVKTKIELILGYSVNLNAPYKLCDFRPLYGLIFEDIVIDYDFWGYCDFDTIWGDLRKYFPHKILSNYDKIFTRGHFTLFRNSKKMNRLGFDNQEKGYYSFKNVATTNYACHYDEWGGVSYFFPKYGVRQYDNLNAIADIRYKFLHFHLDDSKVQSGVLFFWREGRLFSVTMNKGEFEENEYMYIHLQKRLMKVKIDVNKNVHEFLIVPNYFLCLPPILEAQYLSEYTKITKNHFSFYRKRMKTIINNTKNGAIRQRLLKFITDHRLKNGKYY